MNFMGIDPEFLSAKITHPHPGFDHLSLSIHHSADRANCWRPGAIQRHHI